MLASAPHVPMLKEHNVRKGFMEPDQIETVIAELPTYVQPVARFAYATGWRTKSEILPLEWRNVDERGRMVRLDVGTTKNGEGRAFPFTAAVEAILKTQRAVRDAFKARGVVCPYVFPSAEGERIETIRKAWQGARKRAGYPAALIHDLRRSAVRNIDRAGVSRSVAMAMVGHKTESIYRRYNIVDEARLHEEAAKLGTVASGPKAGKVAAFRRKRGA